jgi:WhiB family transcriptional regulator, redox-sensing transcriptional regulator
MTGVTYDDVIKRWLHERTDERWRESAACRGTDSRLWFPASDGQRWSSRKVRTLTKVAKKICGVCPVQRECLEWAVDTDERFGIYGGLTEREREQLTGRRPE